jgi:hypothetical protein
LKNEIRHLLCDTLAIHASLRWGIAQSLALEIMVMPFPVWARVGREDWRTISPQEISLTLQRMVHAQDTSLNIN